MTEYTPEVFAAIEELKIQYPRRCRKCGIANGERRGKHLGAICACLIDPEKPATPDNIGLFCARCEPRKQQSKAAQSEMFCWRGEK